MEIFDFKEEETGTTCRRLTADRMGFSFLLLRTNCKQANQSAAQANLNDYQANGGAI